MSFLDGIATAGHFQDVWNDPSVWSPVSFFGVGDRVPVTGKELTAEDIMYCSVVWRCVNLIADTVAKLPRYLYRETLDGNGERAVTHPLYRVASRAPNPKMTKFHFDQMAMFNACMWGDSYSLIKRDGRGIAQTMWLLDPSRMVKLVKDNGDYLYRYTKLRGSTDDYQEKDMCHYFRHSFNGALGVPISQAAMDAIALCRSFIEYSGKFFSNDATPPWVVMHDQPLTDAAKAKLRSDLEGKGGLSKRFRFAILDAGLKAMGLGINSNRDAQLTEQQKFVIAEIARYFGVPLHKLAELSRSTNNNIAQQALEFYTDCVDAWLTSYGEVLTMALVPWELQGAYYIQFDPSELLFADPVARDDNARKNVMGCIWTPNEARVQSGKPPDPDPRADQLLFPTSHAPGGEVLSAPEPEPEDKPEEDEENEEDDKPEEDEENEEDDKQEDDKNADDKE